jgi:hypothetical protein
MVPTGPGCGCARAQAAVPLVHAGVLESAFEPSLQPRCRPATRSRCSTAGPLEVGADRGRAGERPLQAALAAHPVDAFAGRVSNVRSWALRGSRFRRVPRQTRPVAVPERRGGSILAPQRAVAIGWKVVGARLEDLARLMRSI